MTEFFVMAALAALIFQKCYYQQGSSVANSKGVGVAISKGGGVAISNARPLLIVTLLG